MLPLSSPWSERQRRASTLLLAAVVFCIVQAAASFPDKTCPRAIDCAKQGRLLCKTGDSICGPCLSYLVENEMGRCVAQKKHRRHDKAPLYPDLDEEIDFIHSYIEKQEVSAIETPKTQLKPPGAVFYTNGGSKIAASEQGQSGQLSFAAKTRNGTAAASGRAGLTNTSNPQPTGVDGRAGPLIENAHKDDKLIIIVISIFVVVGTIALILATVCYVKLQKESRLAQKVDYPAFRGAGVTASTGPSKSIGDKTLAESAQMYHYQHQKQQMLSIGNHKPEQKVIDAEVTSDEEEAGDFTVYECPGLAPTGEMEVKNPLFDDSMHYQGNQK
ncbi:neural proliferation differentiation and control protein 1a isoform X2 [Corythoichthys intestinalis]|uniref:neural proliferation differentiation and control protein 1a isoform X2 n=1 Tax=Corythoichthys intestinalis TaxID=161448 RepID=UPI0025A5F2FE|nr:neural proliferation differentiation and control protein 1a isoform X2 [Corythoichthys intestinalis]